MTVRFLSPISPDDLTRQSAPVSYMSTSVKSKDGSEHDVQIYTDMTAGEYHNSKIIRWFVANST